MSNHEKHHEPPTRWFAETLDVAREDGRRLVICSVGIGLAVLASALLVAAAWISASVWLGFRLTEAGFSVEAAIELVFALQLLGMLGLWLTSRLLARGLRFRRTRRRLENTRQALQARSAAFRPSLTGLLAGGFAAGFMSDRIVANREQVKAILEIAQTIGPLAVAASAPLSANPPSG